MTTTVPSGRQPDQETPENRKELVRKGYDILTYIFREDDEEAEIYDQWHEKLISLIPTAGSVVDVGCGCGVPASKKLVDAGYSVTGLDISEVQIRRARELVPAGTFHQVDMTEFDPEGFGPVDAVLCLYVIFHVPVNEQKPLIDKFARWLKPGGILFIIVGESVFEGTFQNWLGGNAPMWWTHSDKGTYEGWFKEAGLDVLERTWHPDEGKFLLGEEGGPDRGFPLYILKKKE